MSYAFVSQKLREHFETNYSSTPVAYENRLFTTPAGQPWVRFNILPNDSDIFSIGQKPCYRLTGIVDIQIFNPKGNGTGITEELIDIIIQIMQFQRLEGVKLQAPDIFKSGLIDEWNQTNVSFNYAYDTR